MNKFFDENFKKIVKLKWYPWVGEQFLSLPPENRFLIVGESHYHDNSPESIKKHNSPLYTRLVIEELAIERFYYGTKIFPNLHKALFNNDDFDSFAFWNLVSYYNFIQIPMLTNKSRPEYEDFYNGWLTFLEVVKLIKPKTCLFVGTTATYSMLHALSESEYSVRELKYGEYISNAYAKTARLIGSDGHEINLIFIRHTSQMFSWSKWHEYLQKTIPDELNWFSKQLMTDPMNKN